MHNKSKNWTDIQLILSSFSIAITLGFWGLFASQEKSGAGVTGQVALPQQPDPVASSSTTPVLLPGQKLLFGGTNPQLMSQAQPQATTQPQQVVVVKKHGGKGGGGGGGGSGPNAGTGSSHP